jgi:hypothetical protein
MNTKKNRVTQIKSRKDCMLGQLERLEELRLNKKTAEWKLIAFRQKEKPKIKLENDVKQDLEVMKIYH